MQHIITADELIQNDVLKFDQTDQSTTRLAAELTTRVLGHRKFAGAFFLQVDGRGRWDGRGGFGIGIDLSQSISGNALNETQALTDALRDGYRTVHLRNQIGDRLPDNVPVEARGHVFALYNPHLAVLVAVSGNEQVHFSPEAATLLRHAAEFCLMKGAGSLSIVPATSAVSLRTSISPQLFSPRQLQVLERLADGLSNPEVGKALSISASLAKQEVAFIMHALGARTRSEAVIIAGKNGLLKTIAS